MKLLINGKYEEVSFWSFMKCVLLVQIGLLALLFICAFILGFLISI